MRKRLLLLVLLTGCATSRAAQTPKTPLYERLGGQDAISAVVDEFMKRLLDDPRVSAKFAAAEPRRLRTMLIDQICEASGGPCKYTGRDMKAVHVGMRITDAEFGATVEDLKGALDQFKVPAAEQGELLGVLGPMKPDIVEVPVTAAATAGAPVLAGAGPVAERAQGLREAATLLEKADSARAHGNRSLADQLFSSAEILVGGDPLGPLATFFREGAPPRINTAPVPVARDAAPQPPAAGNSAEDEPDEKPAKGTLTGTVKLPGGGAPEAFTVVTLEAASGRGRHRKPRHRIVEQRNREFAPRLVVVPVGSTVSFPNFDNIYHNVFSRSLARPFDLGIYRSGQARELVFDREGIVRIGCNLHANMSATVVVSSAPYYAVSDRRGRFAFRNLDPGKYRVRVYSERGGEPTTHDVTIEAADNTVSVNIPADGPPGPLADKFGVPRAPAKISR
jgi:hemoglobin